MIRARALTKHFGDVIAVDEIDFGLEPGHITGFLGPNGSGKTTTMRLILGLDHPTRGEALVNGRPYAELRRPLRTVGSLLETRSFHPGRRARDHLAALARSNAIPGARVDEVLDLVNLKSAANRRLGTFSLGMAQRIGLAAALLGDPEILILDEPVNGLDPDGIIWLRALLTDLAAQGRTIFVSSHLIDEVARVADRVIVIAGGRLLADTTVRELANQGSGENVRLRTPAVSTLQRELLDAGATVRATASDCLEVENMSSAEIADVASSAGIPLHELTTIPATLEAAYHKLTGSSRDDGDEAMDRRPL
jgi:ABC-2 type transport system ATP-binding protein